MTRLQPPGTRIRRAAVLVTLAASCLAVSVSGQNPGTTSAAVSLHALRTGFLEPPPAARLRCYWWWLNGHTDKATITNDLEQMKAKGFGGALLVDADGSSQLGNRQVPAGPEFGSPAWVELFTHALKEADRLGLQITFNITSGWNLGGPDVTPEQASKILTFSRLDVTGGTKLQQQLPQPPERNGYYRQIAVLAYPLQHGTALAMPLDRKHLERTAASETGFSMPDAAWMLNPTINPLPNPTPGNAPYADTPQSGVQDITASVTEDGTLHWTPPPGSWEILRIGSTDSGARVSTSSGAWQGLAIDYMSRAAFDRYWNHTVEPLLDAAKPYHSLRYLATDSWELGGENWTPGFREQFEHLRGYDPIPWLPVIAGRVVGSPGQSTRFLADLRRTVGDLIAANEYGEFAAKARAHGMGVEAESGGPQGAPIDALETFQYSAVPQTEFWSPNAHRADDDQRFFVKEAASAAHIYGQHFVADEGETSIGPQWSESIATQLKPTFDMAVTEGMNRLVWHEFTSSPAGTGLPGQEYFAGTHLNPKVTWWNAGGAFFQYLNRAQFLMQQGVAIDDALYFYGDNVPSFVRLKADDPAHVLPGYDYDVTDEDALLHTIHVEGPDLVGPSGVHWRVLVMPDTRRAPLAVLALVQRYVQGGGTVAGLPPTSVIGAISQPEQLHFQRLVDRIWGGCTADRPHAYGNGRVFCTADTHRVLEAMHVAEDFTPATDTGVSLWQPPYASSHSGVDYVHRRVGTTDVYFVRNASPTPVTMQGVFRVHGKRCELWDAVSGAIQAPAAQGPSNDGRTRVSFSVPAYGSIFVLFSPNFPALPATSMQQRSVPIQPDHGWLLDFQPDRGAPSTPIYLTTLTSWTEAPQPGVRYFSGTATYTASVVAPVVAKGSPVFLHFTAVRELAQVSINGHAAGTVWSMPYTLRVDTLLHPGLNTISIAVTNLWPNRIIGDLQPGNTHRYTQTNITQYKADSPLLPSGLIGPVEWRVGNPSVTTGNPQSQ
jgi:hypothetical protein